MQNGRAALCDALEKGELNAAFLPDFDRGLEMTAAGIREMFQLGRARMVDVGRCFEEVGLSLPEGVPRHILFEDASKLTNTEYLPLQHRDLYHLGKHVLWVPSRRRDPSEDYFATFYHKYNYP